MEAGVGTPSGDALREEAAIRTLCLNKQATSSHFFAIFAW